MSVMRGLFWRWLDGPSRRVEWLETAAFSLGLQRSGADRLGACSGRLRGLHVVVIPELHHDVPGVFVRFDLPVGGQTFVFGTRMRPEAEGFSARVEELHRRAAHRLFILEVGRNLASPATEDPSTIERELISMLAERLEPDELDLVIRAAGSLRCFDAAGPLVRLGIRDRSVLPTVLGGLEAIQPGLSEVIRWEGRSVQDHLERIRRRLSKPWLRELYLAALAPTLEAPASEIRVTTAQLLGEFGRHRERRLLEPHAVSALVTDHPLRRAAAAAIESINRRLDLDHGQLSVVHAAPTEEGALSLPATPNGAVSLEEQD